MSNICDQPYQLVLQGEHQSAHFGPWVPCNALPRNFICYDSLRVVLFCQKHLSFSLSVDGGSGLVWLMENWGQI